ncbi:MAG TPA: adhesin, partial [Actinomycetota bacterium]|nr:adhesin [Actinomycetota bacterium]
YDFGGVDSVFGDAGDDLFIAGLNDDAYDGGAGTDTLDYVDARKKVFADLEEGTADGMGVDTITAVENLSGGIKPDFLTGDAGPNLLVGRDGVDQLSGGDGDDMLDGGTFDDVLEGGQGVDTATYLLVQTPVTADLEAGFATGQHSGSDTLLAIEGVEGSAATDFLRGDEGPNTFLGGLGGDVIEGKGGDDVLDGGLGNDYLDGGTENDTCREGETNVNCESP